MLEEIYVKLIGFIKDDVELKTFQYIIIDILLEGIVYNNLYYFFYFTVELYF
ncbi:hypothetical protein UT300001_10380 [Clostridium sp. CTA-1]|jgi:hypothetical protein|nr:hypothetical protein CLOSPO_03030 [Clostridium sporogenes ATCC 15579]